MGRLTVFYACTQVRLRARIRSVPVMGARASCVDRVSATNGLRRVVARASVLSPAAAVSVSVRSIPDRVQGQPGVRSFFADKTLPLLSIHRCHVVPAGPRPDLFMGWRCSSRRPNYIKGNTPRAHVHNGIALFLAPTCEMGTRGDSALSGPLRARRTRRGQA